MKVYGWSFGDTEPVDDLPPAPPGEPRGGVGSGCCADVPGTGATSQQWTANANQSITSVANPAVPERGGHRKRLPGQCRDLQQRQHPGLDQTLKVCAPAAIRRRGATVCP